MSGIDYNGFGAVKTLNYGNGRRLTLTYDVNRHQMQTMKVDMQNGTDTIINKSYSYTSQKWDEASQSYMTVNDGRIQQITDLVDANYTTNYSYDMFNRLSSATSTAANRSYTYNEWGNIKTVVSNGSTKTYNYTNNASGAPATNRLNTVTGGGTVSYTWDAAGNMTGEGTTTFQYDAAGRMVSVNSGVAGSYGFDGDGKRVKKTEGGGTVYYVESSMLGKTAFEVTSAGLNRALVNLKGSVVALLATDGQFYWTHNDHLGTGRKLTSTTGAVVYRGEFDPHGNSLLETGSTTLMNRKFTGYERDASGLDYAQARMYTGSRGRFTSPDPAGLQSANLTLPQSLNRYSYVNNDPVNKIDPNGKGIWDWIRRFFRGGDEVMFDPEEDLRDFMERSNEMYNQGALLPVANPIAPIVELPPSSSIPLSVQMAQGLRSLSPKCKEIFGLTDDVIDQMVSGVNAIDLRDSSNNRKDIYDIDNIYIGEARSIWNNYIAPGAIAVALSTQQNGFKMKTFLIGPDADKITKQANWDWRVLLAHELLHIKTNQNDFDFAIRFGLQFQDSTGNLDVSVASTSFQNFLTDGCGESAPPPK